MIRVMILLLLMAALLAPPGASAQEETTSGRYKYGDSEMSRSTYEQYEVKPSGQVQLQQQDLDRTGGMYGPGATTMVMNRRMLADSHWNIPFYFERTCTDRACHPGLEKNTHSLRANISCRQCHGGEPISSIGHYYSPMNPIRRHAYVCAKCHEGAGASFARYLVHEPNPLALETRTTFPKLYYSTWAMTLLVVGTLAFFLVHTGLWIIRELITRRREHGGEA